MALSEAVLAIIRRAAEKHPDDIPKAVEEALRRLRPLPEYDELAAEFVRLQVRAQIHDCRHQLNTELKRANGFYGGPAKVVAGESESVRKVNRSLYLYFVGGRTLGTLLGEELEPLAASQEAQGKGCLFNARLLRALRPLTPDGRRVQEAVPLRRLQRIYESCDGETGEAA